MKTKKTIILILLIMLISIQPVLAAHKDDSVEEILGKALIEYHGSYQIPAYYSQKLETIDGTKWIPENIGFPLDKDDQEEGFILINYGSKEKNLYTFNISITHIKGKQIEFKVTKTNADNSNIEQCTEVKDFSAETYYRDIMQSSECGISFNAKWHMFLPETDISIKGIKFKEKFFNELKKSIDDELTNEFVNLKQELKKISTIIKIVDVEDPSNFVANELVAVKMGQFTDTEIKGQGVNVYTFKITGNGVYKAGEAFDEEGTVAPKEMIITKSGRPLFIIYPSNGELIAFGVKNEEKYKNVKITDAEFKSNGEYSYSKIKMWDGWTAVEGGRVDYTQYLENIFGFISVAGILKEGTGLVHRGTVNSQYTTKLASIVDKAVIQSTSTGNPAKVYSVVEKGLYPLNMGQKKIDSTILTNLLKKDLPQASVTVTNKGNIVIKESMLKASKGNALMLGLMIGGTIGWLISSYDLLHWGAYGNNTAPEKIYFGYDKELLSRAENRLFVLFVSSYEEGSTQDNSQTDSSPKLIISSIAPKGVTSISGINEINWTIENADKLPWMVS
ncbi:MAG: hypothetical protein ABIA76_01595 [Candidatus Diapherotrites archaeon]